MNKFITAESDDFIFKYENEVYQIEDTFLGNYYRKKEKWIDDHLSHNYYIILDLIAESLSVFDKQLKIAGKEQKVDIHLSGLEEFMTTFEGVYKNTHNKEYALIKKFL